MPKAPRKTTTTKPPVGAALQPTKKNPRWQAAAICLGLAAITFAVFGQTLGHGFIDFDDDEYVYQNPVVVRGLTFNGLKWAFTQTDAANWHPLTWLSHMLDYQLYGLAPGGHHLTSVLLHIATVITLFLVLKQLTDSLWQSAFVAAVFAIHPLRVESVAWVSERKDVLSGLFFMLTLAAYARYVRKSETMQSYGLVMLLFALGLMCKPMLVTLPLIMLLLDYWPLKRGKPFGKLVLEKAPFLALSVVACVVAYFAQGKAVQSKASFPLLLRLCNALVACAIYLRQMIWPAGLAVGYPVRRNGFPVYEVLTAAILLVVLSVFVWRQRRTRPWMLVGWLWYLVMLLPVIGLIQAGLQAHADRYTYLPQIGIYLALTWLAAEKVETFRPGPAVAGILMASVLGILMISAWKQAACWKDSETLWTHTLAHTKGNYVAHNSLGNVFFQTGRVDEAIAQYRDAVTINPDYAEAHANLGSALNQTERLEESEEQFRLALQHDPSNPAFQNNLAWMLATCPQASLRNGSQAVQLGQEANAITGGKNLVILRTLAAAFAEAGRFDEAGQTAEKAMNLARESGRDELAKQMAGEMQQYEARRPLHP
jgi:protein O-mannosyl-transferase